jgi:hypothetical protein
MFTTLAGLSLAACIGVQILLFSGAIPRTALMIENIEGLPTWVWEASRSEASGQGELYESAGASAQAGGILLKLSAFENSSGRECCLPALVVLVNGVPVADFRYGSAAVVVHRGDLLEVEVQGADEDGIDSALDGSSERRMEIEVQEISPNVKEPGKGRTYPVVPGRTQMGNVIIL